MKIQPMINELLKKDRPSEIMHQMLLDTFDKSDHKILHGVIAYADKYFSGSGLSARAILSSYHSTVQRYIGDVKFFSKTGKYQYEIHGKKTRFKRMDYDIYLLLTVLFTRHRFAIIRELSNSRIKGQEALSVGVGSGLELSFIEKNFFHIDAYDLSFNPYLRKCFKNCSFYKKPYQYTGHLYDAIYAIELLEHLADPFSFLEECYRSLKPEGHLLVTTARNVPQFDHLYNFASSKAFEKRVSKIGFKITFKKVIPHSYLYININSDNIFYVLRKQ